MRTLIALFGTVVLSLILIVEHPDLAIDPGRLSESHQNLNHDCLRCHTLMRGAVIQKCVSCHTLAGIGRMTSVGVSLPAGGLRKILFHQDLATTDCMGCHTIHFSGRRGTEHERFQHGFLLASARDDCASCHSHEKPNNLLHQQKVGQQCVACHRTDTWNTISFDHKQLASQQANCGLCHKKDRPTDTLHSQASDDCLRCHGTERWRPATFDHDKYFRFDRNHPSGCANCHMNFSTFEKYSCYGCHEHSPARMANKHRKEGINDFENCVKCHRSGNEHEAKRDRKRSSSREHGDHSERKRHRGKKDKHDD